VKVGIAECAYKLVNSAGAYGVDQVQSKLQGEDHQEQRRHGCEIEAIVTWGSVSACPGVWCDGGGATLCHTEQVKLAAARAGPSRLAPPSALRGLDSQHS
jgi:hypothetical protein